MSMPHCETITLTPDDRTFLDESAARFPKSLMRGQEAAGVNWANGQVEASGERPDTLTQVQQIGRKPCLDLVIIDGIDVSQAPPTPESYPSKQDAVLHGFDLQHLMVVLRFGARPFSVEGLRNGCITTDIFPQPKHAHNPGSGLSSATLLDWHIDNALNPNNKPTWISLLAIRNRERVPTHTSAVNDTDLSKDAVNILRAPAFIFKRGNVRVGPLPIISGIEYDGRCLLNSAGSGEVYIDDNAELSEAEAKLALTEMEDVINDPSNKVDITTEPGQILLMNNTRMVHGRAIFTPHEPSSERRWLRRYYLKK